MFLPALAPEVCIQAFRQNQGLFPQSVQPPERAQICKARAFALWALLSDAQIYPIFSGTSEAG
jgi:hypothetical protein